MSNSVSIRDNVELGETPDDLEKDRPTPGPGKYLTKDSSFK